MTDTRIRDDLWAEAQLNLDTHVKLASVLDGDLREYLAGAFNRNPAAPLLSVALVALATHDAPPPAEPVTVAGFWQWVRSLFAARPEPTALDRVDPQVREDLACLWNLAREWLARSAADGSADPDQRTFLALCIHIPARFAGDRPVDLLAGALLALTAVRDV